MRQIRINDRRFNVIPTPLVGPYWNEMEQSGREAAWFQVFDRFVEFDKTYVDCGAYVGATLLYAAHFSRYAVGFEPDPVLLNNLKENLRLNPELSRKVFLSECALSDEIGVSGLATVPNQSGWRLFSTETEGPQYTVHSTVLHRFLADIGINDIGFIKMDIEGAEHKVIPASAEWLKDTKPTLLLSMHQQFFPKGGEDTARIMECIGHYKNWYDPTNGRLLPRNIHLKVRRSKFDVLATERSW